MDIPEMTPRRPYLLRAHYEWLLDNELTPHLVVDVNMPGINVPMEYAQDGQIVLNIAPRAVGGLEMTNEWVGFTPGSVVFRARLMFRWRQLLLSMPVKMVPD